MRVGGDSSYRYGFNGKENDNEVKGEGNQQDYGMRVYDNRLGRFLSVDPITKDYPELTPYQFASNRPIDGIDQDGLEFISVIKERLKENARNVILDIQRAQEAKKNYNLWLIQSGPQLRSYNKPGSPFHEQIQQNTNVKNWRAANLNDDGSLKPMDKLAKNKYFQNFANNLFAPLFEGYSLVTGVMEIRALVLGAKALTFPTSAGKISYFRDFIGAKKTQNIGFLEGKFGNEVIADIGISGETNMLGAVKIPTNRVFTTQEVGGYDRLFDSEVKLLENIAQRFRGNTNIEGTLTLASERPFCASCAGVVEQFKKMFPKVKLNVVNGTK